MRMVLGLMLALAASPAIAADQFDLVCSGIDRGKPERQRYRVDLARKEYCFGACERVLEIAEVTSGVITLNNHDRTALDPDWYYNRINRTTGKWEWYSASRRYYSVQDVQGHCEPAEFSGFPATRF